MNSYKTIEEARKVAKDNDSIVTIIEIEPGMEGVNPYICIKCSSAL